MPTPSERKALIFLALVGALGAGVRALRAVSAEPPPSASDTASLDAQIGAVDSARSAVRSRKGSRRQRRGKSLPAREDTAESRPPVTRSARTASDPPDEPRAARLAGPLLPVDLDVASADAMVVLPGIGPALARRIVAERDSCGAFGSLEELARVRGVGDALARRLGGYVTFSGTARPPSAIFGACSGSARDIGARHRRRGRASRRSSGHRTGG